MKCNRCEGTGLVEGPMSRPQSVWDHYLFDSVCGSCGGSGEKPNKQNRSPGRIAQLIAKWFGRVETEKPI